MGGELRLGLLDFFALFFTFGIYGCVRRWICCKRLKPFDEDSFDSRKRLRNEFADQLKSLSPALSHASPPRVLEKPPLSPRKAKQVVSSWMAKEHAPSIPLEELPKSKENLVPPEVRVPLSPPRRHTFRRSSSVGQEIEVQSLRQAEKQTPKNSRFRQNLEKAKGTSAGMPSVCYSDYTHHVLDHADDEADDLASPKFPRNRRTERSVSLRKKRTKYKSCRIPTVKESDEDASASTSSFCDMLESTLDSMYDSILNATVDAITRNEDPDDKEEILRALDSPDTGINSDNVNTAAKQEFLTNSAHLLAGLRHESVVLATRLRQNATDETIFSDPQPLTRRPLKRKPAKDDDHRSLPSSPAKRWSPPRPIILSSEQLLSPKSYHSEHTAVGSEMPESDKFAKPRRRKRKKKKGAKSGRLKKKRTKGSATKPPKKFTPKHTRPTRNTPSVSPKKGNDPKMAFSRQWNKVVLSDLLPDRCEEKQLSEFFENHFMELKRLFRRFSATPKTANKKGRFMSAFHLTIFRKANRLCCGNLTKIKMLRVFDKTLMDESKKVASSPNWMQDSSTKKSKKLDGCPVDNMLNLGEFMEFLARISSLKYPKSPRGLLPLIKLWLEVLNASVDTYTPRLIMDGVFRIILDPRITALFFANISDLHSLFWSCCEHDLDTRRSFPTSGLMAEEEFWRLLKRKNVKIVRRDAAEVFQHATEFPGDVSCLMSFGEFCESLVRIVTLKANGNKTVFAKLRDLIRALLAK